MIEILSGGQKILLKCLNGDKILSIVNLDDTRPSEDCCSRLNPKQSKELSQWLKEPSGELKIEARGGFLQVVASSEDVMLAVVLRVVFVASEQSSRIADWLLCDVHATTDESDNIATHYGACETCGKPARIVVNTHNDGWSFKSTMTCHCDASISIKCPCKANKNAFEVQI